MSQFHWNPSPFQWIPVPFPVESSGIGAFLQESMGHWEVQSSMSKISNRTQAWYEPFQHKFQHKLVSLYPPHALLVKLIQSCHLGTPVIASQNPGAVHCGWHIPLQSFSKFYHITQSVSRREFQFFILFPFVTLQPCAEHRAQTVFFFCPNKQVDRAA